MNLDTTRLRATIQRKISSTNDRIQEIQEEMRRLEDEKRQMQDALNNLEAVERLASEYETSPEPASTDFARFREFSQSLAGPALEKLRVDITPGNPLPEEADAGGPAGRHDDAVPDRALADSAEADRFFAQWH